MIDSCGKYKTADGRVAIINTIDNSTDGYNCLGHIDGHPETIIAWSQDGESGSEVCNQYLRIVEKINDKAINEFYEDAKIKYVFGLGFDAICDTSYKNCTVEIIEDGFDPATFEGFFDCIFDQCKITCSTYFWKNYIEKTNTFNGMTTIKNDNGFVKCFVSLNFRYK